MSAPQQASSRVGSVVFGLTVLYLILELGFNARLLDVAGGVPDAVALDGVELYGRALSGVGAALLLWKLFFPKSTHRFSLFLCCLLTVPGVFLGQRALIDALVENSSGEQRKRADLMTTLRWAAQKSTVQFPGLDLTDEVKTSPEGKTLFAVFPALFYSADRVHQSVTKHLTALVDATVRAQVGPASYTYDEVYLPLTSEIRRLYDEKYMPTSKKLTSAVTAEENPELAWLEYVHELRRRRINPTNPSPRQYKAVVDRLAKKGLYVPNDFKLNDEAAFKESHPANRHFQKFASQELGFRSQIKPGLSWETFRRHEDVQALAAQTLRKEFRGLTLLGPLELGATKRTYKTDVYEPMIEQFVTYRVKSLTADPRLYVSHPELRNSGRNAVRSLLVPPIALGFSLFFGLLNLVGLVASLVPSARGKLIARCGLIAAVITLPFYATNSITSSAGYTTLNAVLEKEGIAQAHALRWLMGAEPVAYPVMNGVRVRILRDFKFQKS